MKITSISDIHGWLPELKPCDVVTISGDISPLELQRNYWGMKDWFENKFIKWANTLDCQRVIFVAGNHDFYMLTEDFKKYVEEELSKQEKIVYLQDSAIEFEGKTFYGAPWVQGPEGWAFCDIVNMEKSFDNIPENCDVCLFHQPASFGDNGTVLQKGFRNMNFGSTYLDGCIIDKKPKWVITGHVHSGNHSVAKLFESNIVNVSVKDENYKIKYSPFQIEL